MLIAFHWPQCISERGDAFGLVLRQGVEREWSEAALITIIVMARLVLEVLWAHKGASFPVTYCHRKLCLILRGWRWQHSLWSWSWIWIGMTRNSSLYHRAWAAAAHPQWLSDSNQDHSAMFGLNAGCGLGPLLWLSAWPPPGSLWVWFFGFLPEWWLLPGRK